MNTWIVAMLKRIEKLSAPVKSSLDNPTRKIRRPGLPNSRYDSGERSSNRRGKKKELLSFGTRMKIKELLCRLLGHKWPEPPTCTLFYFFRMCQRCYEVEAAPRPERPKSTKRPGGE
jgi:hypothetical protein